MSYGKKILTELLDELDSMTVEDYNKLYEGTKKMEKQNLKLIGDADESKNSIFFNEPYVETKIDIKTQISLRPFLQVESKGVYIFPPDQTPQREKVASNNFVFSENTLAKPVFITS